MAGKGHRQPGQAPAVRRDRGTAAIEMALAFFVILLIALGTYEFGSAFADRTAMANAAREGARAGSAAGDFDAGGGNDADCIVIEAAAGALQGMAGNEVKELTIFESDPNGTYGVGGNIQTYKPQSGAESVDLTCSGVDWHRLVAAYPPSERGLGTNQWIGVRVKVEHFWRTGFLWFSGSTNWDEDAVMLVEPLAG